MLTNETVWKWVLIWKKKKNSPILSMMQWYLNLNLFLSVLNQLWDEKVVKAKNSPILGITVCWHTSFDSNKKKEKKEEEEAYKHTYINYWRLALKSNFEMVLFDSCRTLNSSIKISTWQLPHTYKVAPYKCARPS